MHDQVNAELCEKPAGLRFSRFRLLCMYLAREPTDYKTYVACSPIDFFCFIRPIGSGLEDRQAPLSPCIVAYLKFRRVNLRDSRHKKVLASFLEQVSRTLNATKQSARMSSS